MDYRFHRRRKRRRDKLPVQPVQNVWNKTRQTFDAPRYKVNGHGIPPYEFSAGIGSCGGGLAVALLATVNNLAFKVCNPRPNGIPPALDFGDGITESQQSAQRRTLGRKPAAPIQPIGIEMLAQIASAFSRAIGNSFSNWGILQSRQSRFRFWHTRLRGALLCQRQALFCDFDALGKFAAAAGGGIQVPRVRPAPQAPFRGFMFGPSPFRVGGGDSFGCVFVFIVSCGWLWFVFSTLKNLIFRKASRAMQHHHGG
jgi:hypothetical protein